MYQRDEQKVGKYRSKLSSIENEVTGLKSKYLFQGIFNTARNIEGKLTRIDAGSRTGRKKGVIYGKDLDLMDLDYEV